MSRDVDVVIVGAGLAGLSAARVLARTGASVVVLEARERVGGRVYTTTIEGGPWVDLGGQWVGPTQEHLLALLAEHRIPTFQTWARGDNLVRVEGRARRYRGTIPRLAPMSLLSVGWAQWRLDTLARSVPLEAPWKAPRAAEWDATTLADFLDRNVRTKTARRLLEAGLETVFAAPAREISLLHALFYIHSGKDLDMLLGSIGGAQDTRVDGGMQQVAETVAEGLDVRLASPVRRIEHTDAGVVVHHDGGVVRAARAIVAVPPKLVAQIAFAPALPASRAALVASLPMGAVIKHTAVYERPFWRGEGLSGMFVSDEGPIHVVFDNSPPARGSSDPPFGILMGFSEADEARAMGRKPIEARRAAAIACFERAFGTRAREVLHYTDHVWEHDPWSGGCYGAYAPPGVWTRHGPSLREPVGRIHWAGTETAEKWSGYIDGAISSGHRAVTEVLAAEARSEPLGAPG